MIIKKNTLFTHTFQTPCSGHLSVQYKQETSLIFPTSEMWTLQSPFPLFSFFSTSRRFDIGFLSHFFLKRHIEEAWNLCETVKSSSPYLVVQSLNKHFLSILPQNMYIIPSSLQVIKLFLQRLLLEVRLVLDPFGSTCH